MCSPAAIRSKINSPVLARSLWPERGQPYNYRHRPGYMARHFQSSTTFRLHIGQPCNPATNHQESGQLMGCGSKERKETVEGTHQKLCVRTSLEYMQCDPLVAIVVPACKHAYVSTGHDIQADTTFSLLFNHLFQIRSRFGASYNNAIALFCSEMSYTFPSPHLIPRP